MTSIVPDAGVISLARGIPSPDLLPVAELEHCAGEAIRRDGRVALNYGPAAGYGPLREWLAERHGVAPAQVLVTPGSMLALNLLLAERLEEPGAAVVEAPTYDRILHALAAAGREPATFARDDNGLDLDRLDALARDRPRFLYVLPTFHNPTGRTLTLAQRHALVELAVERELLVVEDDAYGLLRIDGEPLPTLHTLLHERGAGELAVYVCSFSKTVAPGLRVGYLVLPTALAQRVEALALRTYVSPPLLPQAQLHEFLLQGLLEPHLERLRHGLGARRDALLEALREEFPATARWTRPDGGYFLWVDFPPPLRAAELLERAAAERVVFVPGTAFHHGPGGEGSARLSFSYPSVEEVHEGGCRLGVATSAL